MVLSTVQENSEICAKHVPEYISENQLYEIFQPFGKILRLKKYDRNRSMVFVRYENVEQVKLALISLKNNEHGFTVDFAIKKDALLARKSGQSGPSSVDNERSSCDEKNASQTISRQESENQGSYQNLQECINIPIGICAVCKKSANKTCSKCDEFYCSEKCQEEDWKFHQHVRFCFKMPKLVSHDEHRVDSVYSVDSVGYEHRAKAFTLSLPNNNFVNNDLPIRSHVMDLPISISSRDLEVTQIEPGSIVAFSHVAFDAIKQKQLIYARPCTGHLADEYLENIRRIDAFANSKKLDRCHLSDLQQYDIVAAPYQDNYYRATILTSEIADPNNIPVAFIDFGNKELVSLDSLRPLCAELKQLRRHVKLVTLEGIPTDMMTQKMFKYLRKLEDGQIQLRVESVNNGEYSFVVKKNGESVNALVKKCIIHDFSNEDKDRIFEMHINTKMPVSTDHSLVVLVLSNSTIDSGFITCIDFCDIEDHEKLAQAVKFHSEGSKIDEEKPYKPVMFEFCLVKYDNQWYRAERIPSNRFEYFFRLIDLGIETNVFPEDIRKLLHLLRNQILAIRCYVDGLAGKSAETKLKLREEVKEGCIHQLNLVKISNGRLYITNKLIKTMLDKQL